MQDVRGKKVFVGLSGGVDSAVSAGLLKQAGADVVGVFIKGWYPPGMPCTWSEDRRDAMRAAAHLHIPFVTLDAAKEYKQGVIDYLLSEYRAGRTPNPDVMCNREVKFGAFWRYACASGADFIATGHYARQHDGHMYRGSDDAKDQSYFLWAVPREALARTIFPLGSFSKKHTRALAQSFALPQASKKDSQGICFLGTISVEDFLKQELDLVPGKAVNEQGHVVGAHSGAQLSTLGERVALKDALPGPWYVLAKDMEKNMLVVGPAAHSKHTYASIGLRETNWLLDAVPEGDVHGQYRYHGLLVAGVLSGDGSVFTPHDPLSEPLAAGQSLVCYRGEELLGGGIIV